MMSSVLVRESGLLRVPLVAATVVGVCVAASQLFTQGYAEGSWCLAAVALSSEVLVLWRA